MSRFPLGRQMLDVFFPRSCVHCGDAVEDSDYQFLCRDCSRELFLSKPPTCTTCGYPFFGMLAGPRTCPHCVELNPLFEQGKTLFLAKGPARSLIHELKYKSGFYVLQDVQTMIASAPYYRDYFKGSILVPVPLHATKERERGFNQSRVIAEALLQATEALEVQNMLLRRLYTQTQTRLSRSDRHQNVKNAFALVTDAVVIPNQTYILIDDVFTTGSTLNACAAVLRGAGVDSIKVATLGHG
ncbi:ComF family protein [Coraliomargarita algicola]|uniref:ComF family protein n=1 Tax=Coraliomargarita algicola TaxID=3092156 RepID=A0ABZ0RG95_9BACT|nr:ComF family protein [Coraliomargarita sp. J2-16]WPJ94118.1 ComF family protein [Coraliomargarita sp. J2-16]